MLDIALGTFATYNPEFISPRTSVRDAVATMNRLGIHHLPVVDDDRRVVGIVSHRDLYSRRQPSAVATEQLTVDQLMVRNVFTVEATSPPNAPLSAILKHGFHCVPVVEEGTLLGVVTSTDFLRELSYGQWPICDDRVDDHMLVLSSDELLFSAATEVDALIEESSVVYGEQSLGTAAGIMVEYGVTEIAVLISFSNPIGILRVDDILQVIASVLE